ncbi:MAG: 4-hydroxy-tetrahydrodipicolinate reductase [Wenzhouxiangella sp.]|jgi:4-hydroxy-tetrahydrodipicolinate reductase|nr:4-hydroxy-tetrahydrodipicolinate reductase [Wenzhouxiangella sp.]
MRIFLSGASGAVGRELSALIASDQSLELVGCADRGSVFPDDVVADVLIDFSNPELTLQSLAFADRKSIPAVIGTTGLNEACQRRIEDAARRIPVCVSANFSVGVTVMMDLVAQAASALPELFDVEISEAHHRRKIDAPSGTALALAKQVADARAQALQDQAVFDRSNRRLARHPGEIGFQVTRGGDVVGEHAVQFLGDGERLVISHGASDRSIFARGALFAAEKLCARPAGKVEFRDLVLGQA